MLEEKRIIEEFPNYFVSNKGTVYKEDGKPLKRKLNQDGYSVVNLTKDGKTYHRRCARLVGFAFHKDTYFEGAVINHKDFDRTNDTPENLEWVTIAENNEHSIKGNPHLHTRGSKYTESLIRQVCEQIHNGVRNCDILRNFDITKDALLKIRCQQAWTWISKDYNMTPSRRGISESTAKWVCYKLKEGLNYDQILQLSSCKYLSKDILKKIKNKKSWTKVSKHIL